MLKIAQAKRFWSITAYTPEAIELVRNSAEKYVVARYTPGLVTNADGSISIYITRRQPTGGFTSGGPSQRLLPAPSWRAPPCGSR
jgi:hypothetical protein